MPPSTNAQAIVQQVVCGRTFVAEQGLTRSCQRAFLDFQNGLKYVLPDVPEKIAAVRLQFGQTRLDHMGLLGVVEMLAAAADPFLGFEQKVRELRADFLRQILRQCHAKKQVNLNVLFVLGVLQPCVQKVG